MNAYESFVETIMAGEEGVFFSVKNEVVGQQFYSGTGKKHTANFDAGPFPLFSVNSFDGSQRYQWCFDNFVAGDYEKSDESIEILESFEAGLDTLNLAQAATETEASFIKKVEALQHKARSGEFWVANLTQSITGDIPDGKSARLMVLKAFYEFLKLDKNHCGGVVITREQIFCSLSPETFLVQSENQLKTYPIKGTGTKLFLEHSDKEISELHMITDLIRNDLGQICENVWLERERYLTEENGFYHARAEVCGQLRTPVLGWKQYQALLPAGSISGAPKARVLKLLKTAESFDRNFYTGTFGVRLSPQKSIFNILIRTLFIDETKNTWRFPVGAGITIESDPKAEWEETLQKAAILKQCLTG